MRTIKFPVMVDESLKPGDLLADCLNPPRGEGVTVTEMGVRLPIAQKLRKANSSIKLEEAEWEELVRSVNRTRWLMISEDILALCRSVLDAKSSEAK